MDLKEMVDKAHKYDNSLEFFEEREKHTKGYIYMIVFVIDINQPATKL